MNAIESQPPAAIDPHNEKILIVDDDSANLSVVGNYLVQQGYQVIVAQHGETGLRLAQQEHPDLILLDVMLPGVDGLEVCRRLQADETTREIPIIFMTIVSSVEDKVKGFAVGGVDYITKPFQAEEVLSRCTTHLTLHRLRQELRAWNRTLEDKVATRTQDLVKANRAYRTLSSCNQAVLHAAAEGELLDEICRIVKDECGYHQVWIGFADQDGVKSVRPIAQSGFGEVFPEANDFPWANIEQEHNPTAISIQTQQPVIHQNVLINPSCAPWRDEAIRCGYASSAVFPLLTRGIVMGTLNVYSTLPDAFVPEEADLLMEMASDLAYGILSLREQAEHERVAYALQESEARYRQLVESMNEGLCVLDPELNITYTNPKFRDLLGYSSDELLGQPLVSLLDAANQEIFNRQMIVRRKGERSVYELDWITKDGLRVFTQVSGSPLLNAQHEYVGNFGVITDITERKHAEQQLRILSRAVEQNPASVIITDTTGAIEYVNPKFTQITGYTSEEVIGKNPRILKSDKTPPDEYARLWRTITAGREWRGEFCDKKKNGDLYWESVSISPILNEAGTITHFVAVKEDITERKRAEEAIRESQQWLSLLVAQSLLAVIECNDNFEIVAWNPAAEQIFGYTHKEVLGRRTIDIITPESVQPQVNQLLQTLLTGGGGNHSINENRTKDGRTILCEWYNSALVSGEGHIVGIASIGADITERRQMEEAQRERERLQSALEKEREISAIKNNMMRTISHEFRTPLTVISSSSFLLARYYERLTDEQRQKHLGNIRDQVHKLDEMVEEIVSAVRGAFSDFEFHPVPTDLELLGQLAITELQSTIGAKHQMTFECEGELQNALIDERLVKRILVNLLSNAIKYTPEGRLIRLRIAEEAENILIQVIDQGIGISVEDQKRLFEPFFRASNVKVISGIGLGLSIVRDCVTLHQGTITTESELNQGTTFTVRLPIHPRLANA